MCLILRSIFKGDQDGKGLRFTGTSPGAVCCVDSDSCSGQREPPQEAKAVALSVVMPPPLQPQAAPAGQLPAGSQSQSLTSAGCTSDHTQALSTLHTAGAGVSCGEEQMIPRSLVNLWGGFPGGWANPPAVHVTLHFQAQRHSQQTFSRLVWQGAHPSQLSCDRKPGPMV